MNRVDRLLGYLLLFQSRGLMRAQDFAARFGICERTVYRDIQALCEVGVPIAAMPGEGYRLVDGYYLPPITFSAEEARALFLAISMLSGLAVEGETQTAAATALDKIRAILPQSTLHQLEALQAIIHFYAFPGPALNFDDPTFLRLQEAIHQQRVVHLRYHAQHTNEVTERDVEPLNLLYFDKTWLLTAYCRLRRAVRVFRLDRIDKLAVKGEMFVPREGRERRGERPLTLTVRFDKTILRWVKERQHFTYTHHVDPQTMVYNPRSFDQIESWLLSWGDKMELLSPPDLRQQLRETIQGMLAQHQS
ncbi:MAG: YafY family transcriptional regulator [Ardenticatenaceae bacterium]|nr:YafY family transcriptional regulator [Ardenticatenaceae bacterium]